MLLSRVADSLYWIGRYLERAEHTVRVVDIAVDHSLGRAAGAESSAIARLYQSAGVNAQKLNGAVAETALFDLSNRSSVAACVSAARDNARQVREEISSDMWLHLNELYLLVRQMCDDGTWTSRTHYVARNVIDGVQLFSGITDGSMGHGEGWQYLRVGRFVERVGATATLLELFVSDTEPMRAPAALDQVEWVALLRSCSALEAYCRHYTADVRSERVAEFLLLNPEFPRSVRFGAARLEDGLRALAGYGGHAVGERGVRLAGRLRSALDYAQMDEILNDSPKAYLAGISRQCAQIHTALHQSYIAYSIDSALPA